MYVIPYVTIDSYGTLDDLCPKRTSRISNCSTKMNMNGTSTLIIAILAAASSFIVVDCVPVGHLATIPPTTPPTTPPLPSLSPPSLALPLEALDRDKNPSGQQVQTREERIQDENNKICQSFKQSSDWFFEPVQGLCLRCTVCVNSEASYCEVCKKPTTTVPSLVDTSTPENSSQSFGDSPTDHQQISETTEVSSTSSVKLEPPTTVPSLVDTSTPEDSTHSFGDNTTDHRQISEAESTILDDQQTTDVSSVKLEWLWSLSIIVLVGLFAVGFCLIKQNKGVADRPPAIPPTPAEEEVCLNIVNGNTESDLMKPYQDTEPVPSCHPMHSSFDSSTGDFSIGSYEETPV